MDRNSDILPYERKFQELKLSSYRKEEEKSSTMGKFEVNLDLTI